MCYRVLLVEDDAGFSDALSEALRGQGYQLTTADDGASAVANAAGGRFDLILLDMVLPDQSGIEVCKQLRESGLDIPVVIVSGRAEAREKVAAFHSGADDYVTKPFDLDELLARMEVHLRRTVAQRQLELREHRFDDVYVKFHEGLAFKNGEPVELSRKELDLLRYLIARRPGVVSREELLSEVWRYRGYDTRTVDMHVASVRRKLETDSHRPRYIVTERGHGYRFGG